MIRQIFEQVQNWFWVDYDLLGAGYQSTLITVLVIEAVCLADNLAATNTILRRVDTWRGVVLVLGLTLGAWLRIGTLPMAKYFSGSHALLAAIGVFIFFHGCWEFAHTGAKKRPRLGVFMAIVRIAVINLLLSFDNLGSVLAITQNYALITIAVVISAIAMVIAGIWLLPQLAKLQHMQQAGTGILVILGFVLMAEHGALGILDNIQVSERLRPFIESWHFHIETWQQICWVLAIVFWAVGVEIVEKRASRRADINV